MLSFDNSDTRVRLPVGSSARINSGFSSARLTATALAVAPCTLFFLSQADLFELLKREPSCGTRIVFQVAEIIGRRLIASNTVLQKLRGELLAARKELETLKQESEPEAGA